jgi:hypothetical protein
LNDNPVQNDLENNVGKDPEYIQIEKKEGTEMNIVELKDDKDDKDEIKEAKENIKDDKEESFKGFREIRLN